MHEDISEGWGICPSCKKEYYVEKVKFPFNDIGHDCVCPACGCSIGWVSKGTDDYNVILKEVIERQQREEAKRPKCPLCGLPMVKRKGYSVFWGCQNYPNCQGTRSIEE